ncbi:hypothetical protein EON63_24045 [archaeon]|nr:MAG: hypothetical protein EON63_24045 [archaeon]
MHDSRFISMSDMKYNAIVSTGIKIVERVAIPPELVPKDAQVEIMAKVQYVYDVCVWVRMQVYVCMFSYIW